MKKVTPQETLIFLSKLFSSVKCLKRFILSEFFAFFFFVQMRFTGVRKSENQLTEMLLRSEMKTKRTKMTVRALGFGLNFDVLKVFGLFVFVLTGFWTSR